MFPTPSLLFFGLQVVGILVVSSTNLALCYYPNGKYSEEAPCNQTAEASHCCDSLDKCLSNGLCIWNAKENSGIRYVRGTCTDQSLTHPLCPQQCRMSTHIILALNIPEYPLKIF